MTSPSHAIHVLHQHLDLLYRFQSCLYQASDRPNIARDMQAFWTCTTLPNGQPSHASFWKAPVYTGDPLSSRHEDTQDQELVQSLTPTMEALATGVQATLDQIHRMVVHSPRYHRHNLSPLISSGLDQAGAWMTISTLPSPRHRSVGRLYTVPHTQILEHLLLAATCSNPSLTGPSWRVFCNNGYQHVDVLAATAGEALENAALMHDNTLLEHTRFQDQPVVVCANVGSAATIAAEGYSQIFPQALPSPLFPPFATGAP